MSDENDTGAWVASVHTREQIVKMTSPSDAPAAWKMREYVPWFVHSDEVARPRNQDEKSKMTLFLVLYEDAMVLRFRNNHH